MHIAHYALDDGIEDACRTLALDPLRRRCPPYAHGTPRWPAGDTIAALRQYDECTRILAAELSVAPGDATVALVDALGT